ncbi:hypothetical protein AVEN_42388-1 [Araneus ventricosus]|uniref:Uncharacterized protein n=1 Tax=Araneus ventricosus TaxID=182803 RepID=A0A4Y2NWJ7_ARAVE|nr:hypothetical protein AVEN_42388-1 [Araneus ventricosus]
MTRVEPFGKVAERFASQQETRSSVRFLVRFPQAFITSLFQAFQNLVSCLFKRLLRALLQWKKWNPLRSRILTEEPPSSPDFQSRKPTNFKFLRAGDRTHLSRVVRQTR